MLVVDDDAFILRIVRSMLEGTHEVVTAADGQAALARLRGGETFDVVVCDLMMPRVTGMEVWDVVNAELPALRDRFLVITGGSADPQIAQFVRRREVPILFKPFTPEELLAAVAARLPAREATPRSA